MVSDDYEGQVIPGEECGLIFVLQMRKTPENLNQDTNPTGDRTRARCVSGNDVTTRPLAMVNILELISWNPGPLPER